MNTHSELDWESLDAMIEQTDYERADDLVWRIWSGYNAMKDLTFLQGIQLDEPPFGMDTGDLEGWNMRASSMMPEEHFRRLRDYEEGDELHWEYVQEQELKASITSTAVDELHDESTCLVDVEEDPYENWDIEHPPRH